MRFCTRLKPLTGTLVRISIEMRYYPIQAINNSLEENDMLVKFSTDAYADITMFGADALALLKMMGHSGTVPSAIVAADVPAALNRLTAAVKAAEAAPSADDKDGDEPKVSVSHRALPLINLLTAAAKDGCDVMWE
jgi:hypothetical protein